LVPVLNHDYEVKFVFQTASPVREQSVQIAECDWSKTWKFMT